jgi:hypothetical protein
MKSLFALLLVAAAACGPDQKANLLNAETAECSYRLPATTNSASIQRTLEDVDAGLIDPCAGALAQRQLYTASLVRIDQGDGADHFLVLVFQMRRRHPTDPPVLRQ